LFVSRVGVLSRCKSTVRHFWLSVCINPAQVSSISIRAIYASFMSEVFKTKSLELLMLHYFIQY
jgi:hypothetical protein